MVQAGKGTGPVGHMVVQDDGAVVSSSGELSSREVLSTQFMGLTSYSLPPNFALPEQNGGGDFRDTERAPNQRNMKWSKISVTFGQSSYSACLSNKKVHIVKHDTSSEN